MLHHPILLTFVVSLIFLLVGLLVGHAWGRRSVAINCMDYGVFAHGTAWFYVKRIKDANSGYLPEQTKRRFEANKQHCDCNHCYRAKGQAFGFAVCHSCGDRDCSKAENHDYLCDNCPTQYRLDGTEL